MAMRKVGAPAESSIHGVVVSNLEEKPEKKTSEKKNEEGK